MYIIETIEYKIKNKDCMICPCINVVNVSCNSHPHEIQGKPQNVSNVKINI